MSTRRTTDGSRGGVFRRESAVSIDQVVGPAGADGPAGAGVLAVTSTFAMPLVTLSFWNSLTERLPANMIGETVTYDVTAMSGGDGVGIEEVTAVEDTARNLTVVSIILNDAAATTTTFDVPNGDQGIQGLNVESGVVNTDGTITFTLSDGVTTVTTTGATVIGSDGEQGIGISSAAAVLSGTDDEDITFTFGLTDPAGTTPTDLTTTVMNFTDGLITDTDVSFDDIGVGDSIQAIRIGNVFHPIAQSAAPATGVLSYTALLSPNHLVELANAGSQTVTVNVTIDNDFTIVAGTDVTASVTDPRSGALTTTAVIVPAAPLANGRYDSFSFTADVPIASVGDANASIAIDFGWTLSPTGTFDDNDLPYTGSASALTDSISLVLYESNAPITRTLNNLASINQFSGTASVQDVSFTLTIANPYGFEGITASVLGSSGTIISPSTIIRSDTLNVTDVGSGDVITVGQTFTIPVAIPTNNVETFTLTTTANATDTTRAYRSNGVRSSLTPLTNTATIAVLVAAAPSANASLTLNPVSASQNSGDVDVTGTFDIVSTDIGVPAGGASLIIAGASAPVIMDHVPTSLIGMGNGIPLYTEFTHTNVGVNTDTVNTESWSVTTVGSYSISAAVDADEFAETAVFTITASGVGGEYYHGWYVNAPGFGAPTAADVMALTNVVSENYVLDTTITTDISQRNGAFSYIVAVASSVADANTDLFAFFGPPTNDFVAVSGAASGLTENAFWREETVTIGGTSYHVFQILTANGLISTANIDLRVR